MALKLDDRIMIVKEDLICKGTRVFFEHGSC